MRIINNELKLSTNHVAKHLARKYLMALNLQVMKRKFGQRESEDQWLPLLLKRRREFEFSDTYEIDRKGFCRYVE
jgi:hypothetical protein